MPVSVKAAEHFNGSLSWYNDRTILLGTTYDSSGATPNDASFLKVPVSSSIGYSVVNGEGDVELKYVDLEYYYMGANPDSYRVERPESYQALVPPHASNPFYDEYGFVYVKLANFNFSTNYKGRIVANVKPVFNISSSFSAGYTSDSTYPDLSFARSSTCNYLGLFTGPRNLVSSPSISDFKLLTTNTSNTDSTYSVLLDLDQSPQFGLYAIFSYKFHWKYTWSPSSTSGLESYIMAFPSDRYSISFSHSSGYGVSADAYEGQSYSVSVTSGDFVVQDDGSTDYVTTTTTETVSEGGIFQRIINSIVSIPKKLVDGIAGLFVPSDDSFQDFVDHMRQSLSDNLGFIGDILLMFADLINVFLNNNDQNGYITFPAFSMMGYQIWGEYQIAIRGAGVGATDLMDNIWSAIRLGTSALLVWWFIHYCIEFYERKFKAE